MSATPGWSKACGLLSVLPCIYFWFCLEIAPHMGISCPGSPGLVLLSVLASIPLSILAAYYWTRWWYSITIFAIATLLFVGLRLH